MKQSCIEYDLSPDVLAFTAGRDCEFPVPVVQGHQVHGVNIAVVTDPVTTREQLEGYDAFVTDVPGVCIGARTADCIPVLLYDPVHRAVAAVHSGWRGTVKRICGEVILRMGSEYGTLASDLLALIGPGICADCFQVGEEVVECFRNEGFRMDRIHSFRGPKADGDLATGHHIDLIEACRLTLIEAGVPVDNISVSPLCTYERTDILYSARKEGTACGRNITAIMLRKA